MMCLVLLGGVWEHIVKWRTHVHHLHTFLHTGSGLYNPLQQTRIVPRPHILYNISTTLYSLQLYSSSTVYNLGWRTPSEHLDAAAAASFVGTKRRHASLVQIHPSFEGRIRILRRVSKPARRWGMVTIHPSFEGRFSSHQSRVVSAETRRFVKIQEIKA